MISMGYLDRVTVISGFTQVDSSPRTQTQLTFDDSITDKFSRILKVGPILLLLHPLHMHITFR